MDAITTGAGYGPVGLGEVFVERDEVTDVSKAGGGGGVFGLAIIEDEIIEDRISSGGFRGEGFHDGLSVNGTGHPVVSIGSLVVDFEFNHEAEAFGEGQGAISGKRRGLDEGVVDLERGVPVGAGMVGAGEEPCGLVSCVRGSSDPMESQSFEKWDGWADIFLDEQIMAEAFEKVFRGKSSSFDGFTVADNFSHELIILGLNKSTVALAA